MAISRDRKRTRPGLLIGLAVAALAAAAIGVAFVVRQNIAQPPADPLDAARAKAAEAAAGLDVFAVEYPQAAQGAELAGALGALNRAHSAFESAQAGLAQIDPAAVEQIAADFEALKEKVDARALADEVLPLAERARQRLLKLSR